MSKEDAGHGHTARSCVTAMERQNPTSAVVDRKRRRGPGSSSCHPFTDAVVFTDRCEDAPETDPFHSVSLDSRNVSRLDNREIDSFESSEGLLIRAKGGLAIVSMKHFLPICAG